MRIINEAFYLYKTNPRYDWISFYKPMLTLIWEYMGDIRFDVSFICNAGLFENVLLLINGFFEFMDVLLSEAALGLMIVIGIDGEVNYILEGAYPDIIKMRGLLPYFVRIYAKMTDFVGLGYGIFIIIHKIVLNFANPLYLVLFLFEVGGPFILLLYRYATEEKVYLPYWVYI